MPRKAQGWITFQASDEERQLLEQICQHTQRSKTEVLRELLRNMERSVTSDASSSDTSSLDAAALADPEEPEADQPLTSGKVATLQSVKISARNILEAKVKRIVRGTVNAEVTLTLAPGVELVASITRASADQLALKRGKSVVAVIKASSIMIGEV